MEGGGIFWVVVGSGGFFCLVMRMVDLFLVIVRGGGWRWIFFG